MRISRMQLNDNLIVSSNYNNNFKIFNESLIHLEFSDFLNRIIRESW